MIASRSVFRSIFHNHRPFECVARNDSYAVQAFSKGGTTVVRLIPDAVMSASFTEAAVAFGNIDSNNAIVPVTNGAAALVPPKVGGWPLIATLVMPSPGALSPRRPIEFPRFE